MRRADFVVSAGAAAFAALAPARVSARSVDAALEGRSAVPVVRARSGARELVLLVDTGHAESMISVQAADALGLIRSSVPNAALARATLSRVTLAQTLLRDHPALVGDASGLTAAAGFPVDGSLGYEAFRDRVVTIDYRKRRLVFPDTVPDGETAAITWLKFDERSRELVTFDGLTIDGFPATAQFDTAVSKYVIIFTTKLPDVAIDNAPKDPLYTYRGVTLPPGKVGSVRFGTTTLRAPGVVVYGAGAEAPVPASAIAAVAGSGLFARFAVTLDFPGSRLIVT
ncbi:MAG: hypothetical protein JWM87_3704 [Candidatus Eremiobacteraeota bacterium]|nr:hypothetical protein [Candidatus Eremiobacteraeota bacterium]